ncbi:hypothetical protein BN873_230041 [Candidatus Competibacter denitrificans Run_A_D11]|uniref:Uncharacterized protein n=1 Tax=Candidatus Competibacter denitrificans Run_A_D11 TaxID=1400863 RepID=W6M367_9GAMM|nr:hypothetical protein BN873_230041 [Candidatus Competibacter denitrificans Run_A_D11]
MAAWRSDWACGPRCAGIRPLALRWWWQPPACSSWVHPYPAGRETKPATKAELVTIIYAPIQKIACHYINSARLPRPESGQ